MASITTFSRLEPQPRRGDITVGAAAPVGDPLWMLARQWQVGEFSGHDGGSPIVARWRGVAAAPTRFVAGPVPPNTAIEGPRFDPDGAPLESIIERVISHFGALPDIIRATIEDLEEVDGVGSARAHAIKEGLSRLTETSILGRYT